MAPKSVANDTIEIFKTVTVASPHNEYKKNLINVTKRPDLIGVVVRRRRKHGRDELIKWRSPRLSYARL